jgi:hypothetical protein
MTFESSVKIFNAAIAKIFKSAIMAFDSADMDFVATIAKRFDMVFVHGNSTLASRRFRLRRLEEIRPRHLKTFDLPRQDSSTLAEPKTSPDTLRPLGANASTIFLTGKTV